MVKKIKRETSVFLELFGLVCEGFVLGLMIGLLIAVETNSEFFATFGYYLIVGLSGIVGIVGVILLFISSEYRK